MENTKNKTHVNKGIKIQLFNHEEAPEVQKNLAEVNPVIVQRLQAHIQEAW